MIPAPRRPDHDEPRPEAQPVRIVYTVTVTCPGDNRAGALFDTYRATVTARTGEPK